MQYSPRVDQMTLSQHLKKAHLFITSESRLALVCICYLFCVRDLRARLARAEAGLVAEPFRVRDIIILRCYIQISNDDELSSLLIGVAHKAKDFGIPAAARIEVASFIPAVVGHVEVGDAKPCRVLCNANPKGISVRKD